MPKFTSTTAARIGAAFGALLLLVGLSFWLQLDTLEGLADAERRVAHLDHAKHAGHRAETELREQYILATRALTRTRSIDDAAAAGPLQAVERRTREAIDALRSVAETDDQRALVARIAADAAAMNREAARSDEPAEARRALATLVSSVGVTNRALSRSFEVASAAARGRAERLRARARTVTLATWIAALLLSAVVGLWLLRSISRPVSVLHAGTRRLAEGDLNHRIEYDGGGEFSSLADAFNQMAAELARQQERQIEAQRLAVLGQFAAGIAHEINNPIGVILGYLDLMKKDGAASPERLAIVEDEARQCQRIVQELLDIARTSEIEPEEIDIHALVTDEVDRLTESGKIAPGRVSGSSAIGVAALADGHKLRQVIANLLINANDAGGEEAIEVSVRAFESQVELTVRDHGHGMSDDVVERAFEPFFSTKGEGTGLGLAICRSIIDAHGGSITLSSEVGVGTMVIVRLPAAERAEPFDPDAPIDPERGAPLGAAASPSERPHATDAAPELATRAARREGSAEPPRAPVAAAIEGAGVGGATVDGVGVGGVGVGGATVDGATAKGAQPS